MKVGGRHYLTQVGVGLDALMIRDTPTAQKKRFGKLAYLWTAAKHLVGFQPRRFTLEVDGRAIKTRASEVIVANVGTLGQPPFRWGPGIRVDDGALDVCVSKARTVFHYLGLFWHVATRRHRADPNVRYDKARRSVAIATKHPVPVQADGEIIGETPVRDRGRAGGGEGRRAEAGDDGGRPGGGVGWMGRAGRRRRAECGEQREGAGGRGWEGVNAEPGLVDSGSLLHPALRLCA